MVGSVELLVLLGLLLLFGVLAVWAVRRIGRGRGRAASGDGDTGRLAERAVAAQEACELRLAQVTTELQDMRAQLSRIERVLTQIE